MENGENICIFHKNKKFCREDRIFMALPTGIEPITNP